ncbi:MAG: type II toxin-antitoxin system HigB family toxin [Bacteroidetes bacterium]|nr:type II toxin-antitoxin system HigB family toxin [Bacteroidota bacterium]
MVVISKKRLVEFYERIPAARQAVLEWYDKTIKADWTKSADVKATFATVDNPGNDRFIFNVGGNKYRLVAMIHFTTRTVYVRFIGTHQEYDKIDSTEI